MRDSSLPNRQLRKIFSTINARFLASLPNRQLRNYKILGTHIK